MLSSGDFGFVLLAVFAGQNFTGIDIFIAYNIHFPCTSLKAISADHTCSFSLI